MIRYRYEWNADAKITERSIMIDYFDIPAIGKAIDSGMSGSDLIELLKRVYTGVADEGSLVLENKWWVAQSTIQTNIELLSKVDYYLSSEYVDGFGIKHKRDKEVLDANKAELQKLLKSAGYQDVNKYKQVLKDAIVAAEKDRTSLEDGNNGVNKWLKTYRGLKSKIKRPVPVPQIPKQLIKKAIAKERDSTVRDLEDSVADLAKMVSLLFSTTSAVYGVLSATQKNKIPTQERKVIEYAITKFKNSTTRGDKQLATEGTELIDKLIGREEQIGIIIDDINKQVTG